MPPRGFPSRSPIRIWSSPAVPHENTIRLTDDAHACRVTLGVCTETVLHVSALLRAGRARRGTRPRTPMLTCFKQALFVSARFRGRPGAGSGLPRAATATRASRSWQCRPVH
jgi:hypothetical protein